MNQSTNKQERTLYTYTKKTWPVMLIAGISFIAANLRAPLTSVGPLVRLIRDNLYISNTMAGMITTLPLFAFALFSPVVPKLARRFGTEIVLFCSLITLTIGILLRSQSGSFGLFLGTAVLGLSISAGNVLTPSLIKKKFPQQIGLMTGIYSVSMNIFAALASGISIPLAAGLKFGWAGALRIWAILSFVSILIWIPQLRRKKQEICAPHKIPGSDTKTGTSVMPEKMGELQNTEMPVMLEKTGEMQNAQKPVMPDKTGEMQNAQKPVMLDKTGEMQNAQKPVMLDKTGEMQNAQKVCMWKSSLAWQVTLYMGLQSMVFYCMVAWMPDILIQRGMNSGQAGWMLSLMQIALIPMTFVGSVLAARRASQRLLVTLGSICVIAGLLGLLFFGGSALTFVWMIPLGIGGGFTFSLSMMFFSLRTGSAGEAARLSGMAQSVGYLMAAFGPMFFGYLHDAAKSFTAPLIILIVFAVICLIAGLGAARDLSVGSVLYKNTSPAS